MKVRKILTSLIVASLLLCIGVICSNAEEYSTHDSCVEEHFNWVQDDWSDRSQYPENEYGSCSYVAISLLLSYYDAYWSDRFIPDQYDYETVNRK